MPLTQAPPVSLPTGGVARQPLVKNSSTDGDASWANDEYLDRVTGRASDFNGSIGAWAASGAGGTATYDGAVGVNGNGSVKIHTTNHTTGYGFLNIAGTFTSGHQYEAVILLKAQTESGGFITQWAAEFGDNGAADVSTTILSFRQDTDPDTAGGDHASNKNLLLRLLWTPSANRTSVWVRFARFAFDDNQVRDLWLQTVRVVEVPIGKKPLSERYTFLSTSDLSNIQVIGHVENNALVGFQMDSRRGGPRVYLDGVGANLESTKDLNGDRGSVNAGPAGLFVYGTQPSGIGRRVAASNYDGVDEDYGPDYVGTVRTERSSSEVEWAPDGSYDVILIDGGDDSDTTHFWFTENADGSQKSAFALLHYLKHGTVDPSAGGGVPSDVGSFYGRNNAGVGELWLKTGAADTAWTKQTTP